MMKQKYLFPNSWKKFGWILFIPSAIIGFYFVVLEFEVSLIEIPVFAIVQDELFSNTEKYFVWIRNDIADELLSICLIVGGLLVAFSKEKEEDEFIGSVRLESLVWATYFNYGVLLLTIIFVYGFPFLTVLLLNMVTTLVIFILRFHWVLYKSSK